MYRNIIYLNTYSIRNDIVYKNFYKKSVALILNIFKIDAVRGPEDGVKIKILSVIAIYITN